MLRNGNLSYSFLSFGPGCRSHCDVIPTITQFESFFVLRPVSLLRRSDAYIDKQWRI